MKVATLGDLSETIDYGVTASADSRPVGPKFLRITDIQDGAVDWSSVPYCQAEKQKLASARLARGDIVFARTGATTGKSFLIQNCPEDAVFASYLIRVRPSHDVDPAYLAHFFDSQDYWRQISLKAAGAAQPGVNASKLKELQVPLPPLAEQKRIAAILDQADALRRLRRRALDRLNTLGQAIFQEMFGDADLPTKSLDLILDVRSSLVDPTRHPREYHVGPEHIRSGSGEVSWNDVRTCQEDGVTSGKYAFQPGDVIYSKIRPYLNKVAVVDRPGLCSADMYALHPHDGMASALYIQYVLASSRFLTYAETVSNRANIPKMNRKQLLAYEAPMPSFDEQSRFAERLSQLGSIGTRSKSALAETEILFASLQHRAFTGQL